MLSLSIATNKSLDNFLCVFDGQIADNKVAEEKLIEYLRGFFLLIDPAHCDNCHVSPTEHRPMKFSWRKCWYWRCTACPKERSVRYGSPLFATEKQRSHISLFKILKILEYFIHDRSLKDTVTDL